MKIYRKTFLIILLVALLLSCTKEDDLRLESLSDSQKGAYSYGMLQAINDKDAGIVMDGSYFARGVLDGFDSSFIYSNTEANAILQAYSQSGISGDCGKEIDSAKAIKSLKKPEGIHKQFSYIAGYIYIHLLLRQKMMLSYTLLVISMFYMEEKPCLIKRMQLLHSVLGEINF